MKGWKTIVFNIIAGIVLIASEQAEMWGVGADVVGIVTVVGNFILRFLTTTPVFNSK